MAFERVQARTRAGNKNQIIYATQSAGDTHKTPAVRLSIGAALIDFAGIDGRAVVSYDRDTNRMLIEPAPQSEPDSFAVSGKGNSRQIKFRLPTGAPETTKGEVCEVESVRSGSLIFHCPKCISLVRAESA